MMNKRWNNKLMEVFTSEELEELDNIFNYLQTDSNKPYQDSIYEADKSIVGNLQDEYTLHTQIYNKMFQ